MVRYIDYKKFGEILRNARIARGLTQWKVAEVLGISSPYYSSIENGAAHPGLRIVVGLANFFSLPLSDVLSGISYEYDISEEIRGLFMGYASSDILDILDILDYIKEKSAKAKERNRDAENKCSQNIDKEKLGKNIQKARNMSGLSVSRLTKTVGIGEQSFRNIESGNAMPSAELLFATAAALETPADYLLADFIINKSVAVDYRLHSVFSDIDEEQFAMMARMVKLLGVYMGKSLPTESVTGCRA